MKFLEIFETRCYTLALTNTQPTNVALTTYLQTMYVIFQLFQKPQITNRDYKVGLFEILIQMILTKLSIVKDESLIKLDD